MSLELLARQVKPTSVYGCQYDYTAVYNCATAVTNYPSCYNYLSDNSCCTNWLSWEYSYLGCLQTAYQNCYDFYGYASQVSAYLPCYSNNPLTAPASAQAQSTTASVPALVLQSVSTAGPTTRASHDPLPSYSGTGGLLKGYCSEPDFALLDGPTAYWAPVVGCVNDKSDCCPYATAPKTTTGPSATTITVVSTVTVNVGPTGVTSQIGVAGNSVYPVPLQANAATLERCPDDYIVVGSGCCPSGYSLWNAPLGGQVPCYSSLKATIDPPPVPISSFLATTSTSTGSRTTKSTSTSSGKPTSAIVNIVYAVSYAVQPSSPGLSTGAKAGIGAGVAAGSLGILGLGSFFFWRYRRNKRNQAASTVQGQPPVAQVPQNYPPPQGQYGYGPQQPQIQPQPGAPVAGYYDPKSLDPQVSQVPGQSPVSYPSPPASTVSPAPTNGYSYQGHQPGYFPQGQQPGQGQGVPISYAPSSATSELPGQQLYGYPSQPPSSAGSPPPSEIHGHGIPSRRPVGSPTQGQSAPTGGFPAPIQELGAHQQQFEPPRYEVSSNPRPGEMA